MGQKPIILEETYEILSEIGSGGGGIIYKAWHNRLEKEVVLKLLRAGAAASLSTQRAEVDILKHLKHSYLPQVYDFVSNGDQVYTVMEYIPGESFADLLKRGEKFPQAAVVGWMGQLCEALHYLHSHTPPILHSDIKPANVMLTPGGTICLIDFNISLMLGDSGAVAVGRSHGYASPEQYGELAAMPDSGGAATTLPLGDSASTAWLSTAANATAPMAVSGTSGRRRFELDVRSDIYSLGATLYHLLTGQRPAVMAREVVPLSHMGAFSEGVAAIVEKAMDPDPGRRFQTAAEMLQAVWEIHKLDRRWHRFQLRKRVAILVVSALFGVSALGAFAGLKGMELEQQSRVLVEHSATALAEGDPYRAAQLALEALPQGSGFLGRSSAAQAERALAQALGVYDLSDGFRPYRAIQLPTPPQLLRISPGGVYAAAFSPFEISVIDLAEARVVATLPTGSAALAEVGFLSDELLIYTGNEGLSAYQIAEAREIWRGDPATAFALSGDGSTVAALYRDDDEIKLYTADGRSRGTLSTGGRRQSVPVNDGFANPGRDFLALNRDGSRLAASFSDGTVQVFDLTDMENGGQQLYASPGAAYFEGGFCGEFFAFAAWEQGRGSSVFAVVDLDNMEQTVGMEAQSALGLLATEDGLYLSGGNLLVRIDPKTGEQEAVAGAAGEILAFCGAAGEFLLSGRDGSYAFAPSYPKQYTSSYACDVLAIGGEWALTGGMDSAVVRILRREDHSAADILSFPKEYAYDEARLREAGDRALLYSYKRAYLLDGEGRLLSDIAFPDPEHVVDQQFDRESGNLTVLYRDALRLYSGDDGALLLEKTNLRSTFYAAYGISILEEDGTAGLLSPATGLPLATDRCDGDFAAFCGGLLWSAEGELRFTGTAGSGSSVSLGDRELIGAFARADGNYLIAAADSERGAVYAVRDGGIRELFSFQSGGQAEAYFVQEGAAMVLSPLHGAPAVYAVDRGKRIRSLEQDAYLTGVSELKDYVLGEYMASTGERFALLLEPGGFETVADLPGYTDTLGEHPIIDTGSALRRAELYTIDQLKEMREPTHGSF